MMKVPEMDDDAELADEVGPIESPETAAHEHPAPRRGRVALACQRCKRRKQRCDGGSPECTSCRKADVVCIYERPIRPRYPGGKSLYINALEERIAFLEARMPEHGLDHFAVGTAPQQPSPEALRVRTTPKSRRPSHDSFSEEESSSLVDGVAYLSLCASGTTDTAPEPFYIGSSSGATIARMIQASIFQQSKSPATASSPASTGPDVLRPSFGQLPAIRDFGEDISEFPPRAQALSLFSVFFDRLHTRWPILDRKVYYQLFERQYDQGALPLIQRSILHLIYAVSARFLQLMKKPCNVDPQRHFVAAVEPMDYILEQHNLATVQFLVLLAIHGQRSPYGAGAWSQVRYAITLCIELGLHRKRTDNSPAHNARDLEIRRRVFWACYCLDRTISLLLGRTFAIGDRDINVEFPNSSPEYWELTSSGSPPEDGQGWSNVLPFIHIIKLRKIQSKIHRTVFRVDKDVFTTDPEERARLDGKIDAIRADLDEWLRITPSPPRDSNSVTWMYDPEGSYHHNSRDFFLLQYHKTILSLFTALLPTLDTNDPRFVAGARSASSVCCAYKRLNQQKTLSYTLTALHSCFIAGLTLVYCLWRDPSLFSYQALESTRACSLCLTIFGEKWPGAVKYRDIFDALSGSLLRSIVNPRPAEKAQSPQSSRRQSKSNNGPRPLEIRMEAPANPFSAAGGLGMSDAPMETEQPMAQEWPEFPQSSSTSQPPQNGVTGGNVNNMILGAVKEAFMEVDEEAPGGYHGWRLFNEMVDSTASKEEHISDAGDRVGGMQQHMDHQMSMTGQPLQPGQELPVLWDDVPTEFYFGSGPAHQTNLETMTTDQGLWTMDGFQGMR